MKTDKRIEKALQLLREGHSQCSTAKMVKAHPTTIKRWMVKAKLKSTGKAIAQPRPKRPKISHADTQKVDAIDWGDLGTIHPISLDGGPTIFLVTEESTRIGILKGQK